MTYTRVHNILLYYIIFIYMPTLAHAYPKSPVYRGIRVVMGSARIYIGTSNLTARPGGSVRYTVTEVGRMVAGPV